ncbi:MAG: hypothetical protein V7K81_23835 [Nostoc sp.]
MYTLEEEYIRQNSGVRMQSVGDSDPPLRKLTTKQENLVGVQKRRLFIHQSHKIYSEFWRLAPLFCLINKALLSLVGRLYFELCLFY